MGTFGVRLEAASVYIRSEHRVMDILKETCRRVDSGYELGVLWKANRPSLPDNYETTLKRLASIKRRLKRDPKLAKGYDESYFCTLRKGLLANCAIRSAQWTRSTGFYLRHSVILPHKPLPRVVFDSAAKHEGICLIDFLDTGLSL